MPASSSNFQLFFNNALKAYEKHTKKDLLAHPLTDQLQPCDSPAAILTVLQQQVQELNQSRTSKERLTKWLDPTVNVLFAFSGMLGAGVGMVCLRTRSRLRCALIDSFGRYSHLRK
jgi:fungal STAND N-terminal Goodbye domain